LCGDEIEISAAGPDAATALHMLRQSVESGLGDILAEPAPAAVPQPAAQSTAPVSVSAGLAIGPLCFAANAETRVPDHLIDDPDSELQRLCEAIAAARISISSEEPALRKSLPKADADIFEAQALVLDDPALLKSAEAAIREHRANAALAWARAFQAVAADYDRIEDEYLRQRAADVRDIGARVLAALGVARPRVGDLPRPGILVVDDLAPAEVIALPGAVLGVICLQGGRTSHASILLRSRGIPAIARAQAALGPQSSGIVAAFDGSTGELWINPEPARLQALHARAEAERAAASESSRHSHEPAITTDGHPVPIFANLSSAADASAALDQGAEGVGLFRAEFLFFDRSGPPGEEEQTDLLRRLREIMGVRPVIVRTLDVGGDKAVPYLGLAREANPFLGERGLRVCLARPELFHTHLRAILRAGLGGNFRIMFPMLSDLGELRAARAALLQAHRALDQSRTPHAWPVPVGVTIEVPSAVILGDQLAAEADFFSIGTNDLAQYLLAADRGNPALARFHDALHPALLRAIAQITAEAHRHGKPVGVCGEMASDPVAVRFLIGLGIDHLSLAPARIPAIKSAIRAARKSALTALAQRSLALDSAAEVRAII
jgi:phosphocarrier protein FPr